MSELENKEIPVLPIDEKTADAKIISISKTVRDPETGEERTVPVVGAEAKAIQYNLQLAQRGRQLLSKDIYRVSRENFCNIGDLGMDAEQSCSVRLFVSMENLLKLPNLPFRPKDLPERLRKKVYLDFTDVPLIALIEMDREKRDANLRLYRRMAIPMFSPGIAAMSYEGDSHEFFGYGRIALCGGEEAGYTAAAVFDAFRTLAGILVAAGCMDKVSKKKNTGLYILPGDDYIAVAQITGKARPALAGQMAGSFVTARPYTDDETEGETDGDDEGRGVEVLAVLKQEDIDALLAGSAEPEKAEAADTFESLTQAAADGDAQAMKRLGKMYETGDGAEQNNEKAMELYRKAQALLPDDKDLEFDIFMLEMLL